MSNIYKNMLYKYNNILYYAYRKIMRYYENKKNI